jgi:hypothetical protein
VAVDKRRTKAGANTTHTPTGARSMVRIGIAGIGFMGMIHYQKDRSP